jgi:hypothetical protein
MGMNIAHYPEDRKGRCNFLEFPQSGILTHGHMGPRPRCVLQVRLQDGGALLGGNLFEVDLLTLAAAEHCASPAARTFWTQFTFSPSIDTRYLSASTTATTTGSETVRPDFRPVTSNVTTELDAMPEEATVATLYWLSSRSSWAAAYGTTSS